MPFYLGYDWHLLQGRLSSAANGWDTVSRIQGTDNRSHLFLLHECLDLGGFSFFMYIGEALLMISLQDTEGDEVSHQL